MNAQPISHFDFKMDRTGRLALKESVVALTDEVNDFVHKVMQWKKDSLLLGQLTEILADAYIKVNPEGLIVDFNAAACKMFATSAEYMLGKSVNLLFLDSWATLVSSGKPYLEHRVQTIGGKILTVSTSVTLAGSDYVFLVRDLTRDLQNKADIRILSQALDATSDVIVVTNKDNKILFVNRAFTNHTGYSKEEALGKDPGFIGSSITPQSTYSNMWTALTSKKAWAGVLFNESKDGTLLEDYTVITPIMNRDPEVPSFYIAVKRNIETHS